MNHFHFPLMASVFQLNELGFLHLVAGVLGWRPVFFIFLFMASVFQLNELDFLHLVAGVFSLATSFSFFL